MGIRKPVIHGRDHLPGGADPIPGLQSIVPTLYLWSSFDASDSNVTVPAWSGSGGTYRVEYAHMESTNAFWNDFEHGGSSTGSVPVDTVVVPAGFYLVSAWWLFIDSGNLAQLGAQLNMVQSTLVSPNRFYTDGGEVDDSTSHGVNAPLNPNYTGQFDETHTFYVPAGETGRIYTDLFHEDNHTIDLRANWTLGIHKLS